ncbi:MAG: Hpt domain-containing protein, partial [Acidobacteriota bacterium]|nr:Hpt domain-containing protein [Acidobacteriota bacterium]
MSIEILQGFVKQAEENLPTIRGGILICAQAGSIYGELQTSLRQIASIRNAALIIGLGEIAEICGELEENLKASGDSKEPFGDERARALLDKITELEAAVARTYFSEQDFSDSISNFVEESFEQFQSYEIGETDAANIEEPEEEFEIDEEMLEVFALEAADLVQNINVNLKTLEKSPSDREALLEVRRSAHTLKGSAGIVGLKRLSQIAHRIEDLLDYLAEKEIGCSKEIFGLLLAAASCFEELARDEKSLPLARKISQIYENFDVIMAQMQTSDKKSSSISHAEKKNDTLPATGILENAAEENPPSGAAQNRCVVRVSLEKLDELVKIASGLVVSRSVFERHLAELERQIDELRNSTRRLQRSTSKLEIDFEADMLGSPDFFQSSRRSAQKINRSAVNNFNEFDLLELDKYTEFHQTTRELLETTSDTFAINSQLDLLKGSLEMLFDNQRRLIEEMQEKLLRLRMVSFDSLSVRLHRTVRVTCDEEEKLADLFIEGEHLELDTQILDCLIEPLLHLLRNAVAHGVEQPEMRRLLGKPERGKITLRVMSERTHIIVAVSDDGRGISVAALREKAVKGNFISREKAAELSDEQAFELIFLPGLTTAEKLSQVAGRGVGMNIVKANLARCQGTISINSETQKGTTFTLRVPLTSAVSRAVLVKADEQTFAFPINLVKHFTEIPART